MHDYAKCMLNNLIYEILFYYFSLSGFFHPIIRAHNAFLLNSFPIPFNAYIYYSYLKWQCSFLCRMMSPALQIQKYIFHPVELFWWVYLTKFPFFDSGQISAILSVRYFFIQQLPEAFSDEICYLSVFHIFAFAQKHFVGPTI